MAASRQVHLEFHQGAALDFPSLDDVDRRRHDRLDVEGRLGAGLVPGDITFLWGITTKKYKY
jgi:hypothetical protein